MTPFPDGPAVFAVEDRSAQLTWRALPPGSIVVAWGDRSANVESTGGPGTLDLDGLRPDTVQRVTFRRRSASGSGRADHVADITFRTLPSPPGEELFRMATMSDLHLGRTRFGVRGGLSEPDHVTPHPIRCSRAATADLLAWGAAHLVIKGDFVDANTPSAWRLAGELTDGLPIPWHAVPGNHELAHGEADPFLRATEAGIDLVAGVTAVDVPGVRLVLMNSGLEGIDIGKWSHLRHDAVQAAAEADGPAFVLVHHQPQLAPIPLHFPPGIDSISAGRFARHLARANPASIGSSGHTHRHRRRTIAGIPWTEVGSPKDYPGTWAGYVVHEGGIRQVVRRISDPDCLQWLDRSSAAALGLWGLWSPGRLRDRCFTHVWPVG